jgi:hypothetical protein
MATVQHHLMGCGHQQPVHGPVQFNATYNTRAVMITRRQHAAMCYPSRLPLVQSDRMTMGTQLSLCSTATM